MLPRWSPDDETVYFTSSRSGRRDVYSKSSSGTGTAKLVYGREQADLLWSLSPDGKTGWLVSGSTKTGYDIYRLDLESKEAQVVLQTPFRESSPVLSPDGRRLLYQSDESGRTEMYVQSLGDDGGKWQVSTDGGRLGRWTRGGREIVFRSPEGMLLAAEVTLEPAFSAGSPEILFDLDERIDLWPEYDVTPDGRRFLVNRPVEQSGVKPLTLVQNWASELER